MDGLRAVVAADGIFTGDMLYSAYEAYTEQLRAYVPERKQWSTAMDELRYEGIFSRQTLGAKKTITYLVTKKYFALVDTMPV
jgi:hypothetical protein